MTILDKEDADSFSPGGRIQGETARLALFNYPHEVENERGKLDLHLYAREDRLAPAYSGWFDLADVAEILNRIPGFTASYNPEEHCG